MKYITRELKGTYGYVKKQTYFEILKTVLLFAMAFGIFAIGYLTLGTKKSLWSVFAVLALLPASKSMVSMIMFLRYRSIDIALYDKVTKAAGAVPLLFELIFTTSDKTYFVESVGYSKGSLIAYSSRKDISGPLNKHFNNVLANGGYKDISVKVFDNLEDYLNRLAEMNSHLKETDANKNADSIFTTLKAVSL